ncbi:MAG: 6,7-dimethyl-8-ribityllumazine synthase [Hyphomicrobiaceae bacterium]
MAGPGSKTQLAANNVLFADRRILLIEGRYYEDIGDALLEGAKAEISAAGAQFSHVVVPGALEIPQVLSQAVEKGIIGSDATNPQYHGAVALGCVIRGETYHFEIVCDHANHWLMDIATCHGIPVGNAILTVDTHAQALARAEGGRDGKGGDAMRACLRLIEIAAQFETQVT